MKKVDSLCGHGKPLPCVFDNTDCYNDVGDCSPSNNYEAYTAIIEGIVKVKVELE